MNTEDRVQETVAMATTIPSELSINDADHDAEIEHFIADVHYKKVDHVLPNSLQMYIKIFNMLQLN